MKNRPADGKKGTPFRTFPAIPPRKSAGPTRRLWRISASAVLPSVLPAEMRGKAAKNSQDIYSSSRPVRRKKGSIGKKIVAVLLVLVVVLAGSLVYMLSGLTMTSISKDSGSLGIQSGAFSDSRIVNIALFGLDAREDTDSGRSDVVMVLSVDKRHHTLKLTSILRDSEVAIEGYGYDKITHAYAYGGPELAIKTINQNFNLDIKNYVTVNFHQMAEIVDAFGGVDMDLTADEVYQLNQNLWTLSQESPGTVVSSDYILNIYGEMDLINGPFEGGTYHLKATKQWLTPVSAISTATMCGPPRSKRCLQGPAARA